jgi:gamma-glutamyl-gamma-aminobutyrate hydrolase PuuD
MSAPIIGLTAYNENNKYGHPIVALMQNYIRAVSEAGGVPVLIPPSAISGEAVTALLKKLDGIRSTCLMGNHTRAWGALTRIGTRSKLA